MRRRRSGVTLVEMLFVMALSGMVLGVGYKMYASTLRAQDIQTARESAMLTIQNAMARVKQDVRAATDTRASGGRLVITGENGGIRYYNVPGKGLVRADGASKVTYKDITARFTNPESPTRGVNVTMQSSSMVHRRPIRIEITSFISPRN